MIASPRARFRVDGGTLSAERVRIERAEAHHIRVMRLAAGDHVVLFDGVGEEAVARLEVVTPNEVVAKVLERYIPETESVLEVWLAQAIPTKLARMDLIVRQCTELGMTQLLPVISERNQVPSGGIKVICERRERWIRVAQAAAKQSGRCFVPQIAVPTSLRDLDWTSMPPLRFMLDPSGQQGALACKLRGRAPTSVALVVGPEGGWDSEERAITEASNGTTVAFGPRVLRADTAGAAAMAVLQHAWGDLG